MWQQIGSSSTRTRGACGLGGSRLDAGATLLLASPPARSSRSRSPGHSSVPFSKTSKFGLAFISRRWSSSRQGTGGAPLVCWRSLASTAYAGSSWCAPRTGLSGAAVVGSCGAGRSQGDAGVHGGRQLKYRVVHGACLASPSTAPSSSCSAARCRSWGGHRGVSVQHFVLLVLLLACVLGRHDGSTSGDMG